MKIIKQQQGSTLIELMISIAILAIIISIAIPAYQNYMIGTKWGKTVYGIRALKLAIENCLSDNSGALDQCDSVVPAEGKIAAYGVTQYAAANDDYQSIELVPNKAAIKITGKEPLVDCILYLSPSLNTTNSIVWDYYMTGGSSLSTTSNCTRYMKGAIAS